MQRKSKKVNKAVCVSCVGCTVGVFAASVSILCGAAAAAKANRCLDKSDFLKTGGRAIKNARGETVVLRGINIGGWLLQESRMCPNSGEDKVCGYYDTLSVLTERFGEEKAAELINTYLDNWFTISDINYLKSLGVNCIRVPFCCRNLQRDDKGTWIRKENGAIDLSRLDWIVEECGKRGIYVILDMHGAPGFQSNDPSCGRVNASTLFECSLAGLKCRGRTAGIWMELARHFKGNPAVAAFDLLNEPMNGFAAEDKNDKQLWRFYNKLYKAVRAEDPDRMITVEGIWALRNLPDPKEFCWTNIVYQLHFFNRAMPEIDNMMKEIDDRAEWNVPVFAGEIQADGMWDYTLNAFNKNALSWCTRIYKGTKTEKSDRFLFAGKIEAADLQEDSFEQIKTKWAKPCRTSESFAENTELAAVLKKYLKGYAEVVTETPENTSPDMVTKVYASNDDIPHIDDEIPPDPFKVVFGTATLVGVGTLASMQKKRKATGE